MGWAVVCIRAGDESNPRAFVEFGEHPIGQRLKRSADTVLTGQRHCQPGGKQGAENQRGRHGWEISWEVTNERVGTGFRPVISYGRVRQGPGPAIFLWRTRACWPLEIGTREPARVSQPGMWPTGGLMAPDRARNMPGIWSTFSPPHLLAGGP